MSTLIDSDFDDGQDVETGLGLGADVPDPPQVLSKDGPKEDEIEIVVQPDAPPADRGRPTADDLPTDDGAGADDEAASYSKRVQERIKKETARFHAERRAKEDRERQLSEAAERLKAMIRENNQLKEMVEGGEKVLISEHTGRLMGEIEKAKAAYREAHEAGDVNGVLAAQDLIAKANAKLVQAEAHQTRPLPRMSEEEIERLYRPAPQAPQPDPRALEWTERNPWFQRDEVMTYVAMATHKKLVAEGVDPQSDEYYNQIDSEVRKRFPEKFQNSQQQQTARRRESVVAPPSRQSVAGGGTRTRVVLSESQVKLARRLGLTPEQYASQVAAESRTQGEWVHGKS